MMLYSAVNVACVTECDQCGHQFKGV